MTLPTHIEASPPADEVVREIAAYVAGAPDFSAEAYLAAHLCLVDSLACALFALDSADCRARLGPIVPGATMAGGARVPWTSWELDPVQAAFNIGTMIRWLDFNDTWLAAEWGHPSDNLGGILPIGDFASRSRVAAGDQPLAVRDLLHALVQAYEIQGVLALENSFNRLGIDHVILVRVATAAVATSLLGGSEETVRAAVSNAWVDGAGLRVYRHAPNVGPRKSWAAGDATSRGVWHALMAMRGEPEYLGALSTPTWGYEDALNQGAPIRLGRPLGSYVVERVLFKVPWPAEFHAQTAVEAAVRLHPKVRDRVDEVARVRIDTQESALRIIDKRGPLRNPADRDHCLQYAVAVALIRGTLTAEDYEDEAAADPRIDRLRETMEVVEQPAYSRDYLDPEKRSVGNAVQVWFQDGSATPLAAVEYPLGHPQRRAEAIPYVWQKLEASLAGRWPKPRIGAILDRFHSPETAVAMAVPDFMELLTA